MSTQPNQITEEQVVAFLTAKTQEIKAKLGANKYAVASISVASYTTSDPLVECRIDSGAIESVLPAAKSFADALASLEERTPQFVANQKREAAARLLAEAASLEAGVTKGTT